MTRDQPYISSEPPGAQLNNCSFREGGNILDNHTSIQITSGKDPRLWITGSNQPWLQEVFWRLERKRNLGFVHQDDNQWVTVRVMEWCHTSGLLAEICARMQDQTLGCWMGRTVEDARDGGPESISWWILGSSLTEVWQAHRSPSLCLPC